MSNHHKNKNKYKTLKFSKQKNAPHTKWELTSENTFACLLMEENRKWRQRE